MAMGLLPPVGNKLRILFVIIVVDIVTLSRFHNGRIAVMNRNSLE